MCGIIILLTISIALVQSTDVHVFLIAGQSNSVGLNSDGFTSEDASNVRIYQLTCCGENGTTLPIEDCWIVMASDPLHHLCSPEYLSSETIGYGMSFAREFIKNIPYEEAVVLVPAGLSGTGFYDNVWTAETGVGFSMAVSKLIKTFDILQNLTVSFDGIIWHQGEYDAGDNGQGKAADTDTYLNKFLIPMINSFRNEKLLPFTNPSVPFVCANLLPSWGTNSNHTEREGVWDAIALLDQYVPYTGCAPSQGLLGDSVYLSGLNGEIIHFTARSQRILGKRFYAAWNLAKQNVPDTNTY